MPSNSGILKNLSFSFSFLLFTVGIACVAFGLVELFPQTEILVSSFWVIFGFMAGITYIAFTLVSVGMKRSPESSILAIMSSIGVKMFFALAFVLIYRAKHDGLSLLFVLNFFSLYLLFTLFEISALLRNLRHQNK